MSTAVLTACFGYLNNMCEQSSGRMQGRTAFGRPPGGSSGAIGFAGTSLRERPCSIFSIELELILHRAQKIAQHLNEGRAGEDALVRVLQSQIAMTPSGSYRSALQSHLDETSRHSARVAGRVTELDTSSSPLLAVLGFWERTDQL